jgi:single-strand DNA-binding protein|nr:MAG TPA: Single strand binding protein [Caudoviricetes sp.]DAP68438.1 MAG TPA: Single strand binding protein [Caudoviricetes sp.]
MNKVILIGRLVADPEIRYTQSGKAVASYRLAVDRPFKQDGQQEADFINCVAWGKTGEFAGNYLRKGTKIAVEGRIQTGSYEKDGVKHYTTDIVVDRHEFCESRSSGQAATANSNAGQAFTDMDDDGDLPF